MKKLVKLDGTPVSSKDLTQEAFKGIATSVVVSLALCGVKYMIRRSLQSTDYGKLKYPTI